MEKEEDKAISKLKEIQEKEKGKDMKPEEKEKMKKMFGDMSKDEMKAYMDACDEMYNDMYGKDEEKAKDSEKAKDMEKAKDEEEKAKDMEKAKDSEKAKDEEEKKADDEENKAMDAANIEAIVTAKIQEKVKAAEDVRPVIGKIDGLSFDSAEEIYGHALKAKNVDISKHDPSSYKSMFSMYRSHGQKEKKKIAFDSKGKESKFEGSFENLKNINIMNG